MFKLYTFDPTRNMLVLHSEHPVPADLRLAMKQWPEVIVHDNNAWCIENYDGSNAEYTQCSTLFLPPKS